MPSSSIASANKEVESLLDGDKERCGSKRGQYIKCSDEERAKVAKQASEMGFTNVIRFFRKEFSDQVKLSRGLQVCSLWWAWPKLFMQLQN